MPLIFLTLRKAAHCRGQEGREIFAPYRSRRGSSRTKALIQLSPPTIRCEHSKRWTRAYGGYHAALNRHFAETTRFEAYLGLIRREFGQADLAGLPAPSQKGIAHISQPRDRARRQRLQKRMDGSGKFTTGEQKPSESDCEAARRANICHPTHSSSQVEYASKGYHVADASRGQHRLVNSSEPS
jgi:hypothetical protein